VINRVEPIYPISSNMNRRPKQDQKKNQLSSNKQLEKSTKNKTVSPIKGETLSFNVLI
jgi:hypothetical protein